MSDQNNTQILKVYTGDLEIGMYVSKLDRPWLETTFLFQGFRIETDVDIEAVENACKFVYVDTLKSAELDYPHLRNQVRSKRKKPRYEISKPVEHELKAAYKEYSASLGAIEQLLSDVQEHNSFDSKPVKQHVKQFTSSILRNPSAMMWLSRIKHADNYTAEHCLNVGMLAVSLGRHLGFERSDLETLGLSGMLHDVGKMLIDPTVLNKTGKLTGDEFDLIKQHTILGKDMLESDTTLSPAVIESAYYHHERVDGSGYPAGINASRLSVFCRIITIVDAFDAMTSQRCYSTAKPVSEALKILYDNRAEQFDEELTVKFIECMGIYPPGCIVELETGEVGFVINNTPSDRLLPRVALLLDQNKQPVVQHIKDLSKISSEPDSGKNHIRTALPDGSYGLYLKEFTQNNINLG